MNKIIVYEQCNFKGLSREFTSDVCDLRDVNFNNCISSLKVIGNPWLAYTNLNFAGKQFVYEEGEYSSLFQSTDYSLSSLELVKEDLDNPQITLYEHVNYKGKSLVLNCETNLRYGSFNNGASSHKVQRGAWVLYGLLGGMSVARVGCDCPISNYVWFYKVNRVRPLKAGRPIIKAEVEWDKKKEDVKTVTIDCITCLNHGSVTQTLTTEMSREYSGSVTQSFNWSNSTKISLGTKFNIKLFCTDFENTLNISNTFTVENGQSNTKTTTESTKISLPVSIPPHTKLTVNMLRKVVIVTVPVKLTITTGCTTKVEYGEYRCEDGNSITTEFKEEKI